MAVTITGKVEKQLEIAAPAKKFYKLWKNQSFHLPTCSPSNIQGVEIHEGDWEATGSVKLWKYTVEGRAETLKEKVEADDETMTVTLHGIEGDPFKDFKSWKPVFKVAPKATGKGSVATISIEYEKRNADVPDPVAYVEFMAILTQDVSAHVFQICKDRGCREI